MFRQKLWRQCVVASRHQFSNYNSNATSVDNLIHLPLDQQPANLSITFSDGQSKRLQDNVCHVTTLSNGMRVASQNRFGAHCTVGVAVHAGSRFETNFPSGVSNFIEKLGFQSTASFESRDVLAYELERCRVVIESQAARDLIVYAASGSADNLDQVMEILSEVVLQPRVTKAEIDSARSAILFDRQTGLLCPPPDRILDDAIHAAAFRGNTLGHPLLCPETEAIDCKITQSHLLNYMASVYKPERMVITGVGVSHETLLKAAEKSFLNKQPIWKQKDCRDDLLDDSVSQHTGGSVLLNHDLEAYHYPMPEVAYVSIGLQSTSCLEEHFVTACVLQTLLGGGASFSAGGPGKGMHARLYSNVLNQYHWVNSILCQNYSYLDNGVFCITGSAEPPYLQPMVEVICQSLVSMADTIKEEELNRAKNQLKSNLLMHLESSVVLFEDVARAVIAYGKRRQPQEWIEKIDGITVEKIHDFVHLIFQSKPSVAGFGKLGHMPSYDDISGMLQLKKRKISNIFTFKK